MASNSLSPVMPTIEEKRKFLHKNHQGQLQFQSFMLNRTEED